MSNNMILPKMNNGQPRWKAPKRVELDRSDSFTVWVVVIEDTSVLAVTTSKRKAMKLYRRHNKLTCVELWKKTVTLTDEGKPVYQVVNPDGSVVREYNNPSSATVYQANRKDPSLKTQRVTRMADYCHPPQETEETTAQDCAQRTIEPSDDTKPVPESTDSDHATTDSATSPEVISLPRAERLCTALEMISEDLQLPIELSPTVNRATGDVTGFTLALMLPDSHLAPGKGTNEAARAIAVELDNLGVRLSAVAQAVRIRYPAN